MRTGREIMEAGVNDENVQHEVKSERRVSFPIIAHALTEAGNRVLSFMGYKF
jgi:hypothetical protein